MSTALFRLIDALKLLKFITPAMLVLLAISSCVQESQSARRQQEPAPPVELEAADSESEPESTQPAIATSTTLPPEGQIADEAVVTVGDCFNNYRFENERTDLTEFIFTIVNCDRPHEGEVYHQISYPDPEFPGASTLEDWSQQECYKHFQEWVGQEYELSELDFSTFLPTEELWNEPIEHSKRLSCYLRTSDGSFLSESHRNSAI